MSTTAPKPAAFAIRLADRPHVRSTHPGYQRLRPTEDGWSLVGGSGEVVFRAFGPRGRRDCLEYARAHGIVAVLS